MKPKRVFIVVVAFSVGIGVTFVAVRYFWRPIPPISMPGGMENIPRLSSDGFDLKVSVSPKTIRAGKEAVLTAKITSKSVPHARTKISFFLDDKKLEEFEGVLPPYQSETVNFRWRAEAGNHTLRVILASPVGVEFARWVETLEVAPQ